MTISSHSYSYLPQLAGLRARRLIAQGLAPSEARPKWQVPNGASQSLSRPWAVAHGMVALQGQNYASGISGISVRGGGTAEEVQAAINSFEIVRCWSQRGTLHFVTAQDARWIMRLTNPRIEKAAARRRPGLGLAEDAIDIARAALHAELLSRSLSNPLTRREAYQLFADHGIDPAEQRGPHLLRALGGEGDVVQGPRKGSEETFVHVDSLPFPSSEPNLEDLAWRYVNSRGPVCVDDLAWWLGITKSQTKKVLSLLDDRVIPFSIESSAGTNGGGDSTSETHVEEFIGRDFVMPAWQEAVTKAELEEALSHQYLLPAFDEYLLGYGTRHEVLADSLRNQVLTKNGVSWPFIVENGVITGRQ